MNVRLEELFTQYHVTPKDRHEITQIYEFMSLEKRRKLIDNFEMIIANINNLRQAIWMEQEFLLGQSLRNIEEKISYMKKDRIVSETLHVLNDLKKQI